MLKQNTSDVVSVEVGLSDLFTQALVMRDFLVSFVGILQILSL